MDNTSDSSRRARAEMPVANRVVAVVVLVVALGSAILQLLRILEGRSGQVAHVGNFALFMVTALLMTNLLVTRSTRWQPLVLIVTGIFLLVAAVSLVMQIAGGKL